MLHLAAGPQLDRPGLRHRQLASRIGQLAEAERTAATPDGEIVRGQRRDRDVPLSCRRSDQHLTCDRGRTPQALVLPEDAVRAVGALITGLLVSVGPLGLDA